MQVIHPVCCGIAVHAAQLTACLRRVSADGESTTALVEYGTTCRALIAFRPWLQAQPCPVVAMEGRVLEAEVSYLERSGRGLGGQ